MLTGQCRSCDVRNWCNGGCPKDRFVLSRDGEPGHNYLCAGLYTFFQHVGPAVGVMDRLLRDDRAPADIMASIAELDAYHGPHWPCACGSGKEFRFCHGDDAAHSSFSAPGPMAAPDQQHVQLG
jgi:uncharacterized protein